MKHPIIEDIIKKKQPCYFISPHFDDAVLSAGALLTFLAKKTPVTVVNIFTKAEKGAATFSAKQFLRQCGYTDAVTLFEARQKEDAVVLEKISDMIINLGHTDALWRKKYQKDFIEHVFPFVPEAQVLYPTYRFHVVKGRIVKADGILIEQIKKELQKIIVEKDAVIFGPVGIGNHVDHVITRKVCDSLNRQHIYWADFPYSQAFRKHSFDLQTFSFSEHLEEKETLAQGYKTQYQAMFPNGFSKEPEVFFY